MNNDTPTTDVADDKLADVTVTREQYNAGIRPIRAEIGAMVRQQAAAADWAGVTVEAPDDVTAFLRDRMRDAEGVQGGGATATFEDDPRSFYAMACGLGAYKGLSRTKAWVTPKGSAAYGAPTSILLTCVVVDDSVYLFVVEQHGGASHGRPLVLDTIDPTTGQPALEWGTKQVVRVLRRPIGDRIRLVNKAAALAASWQAALDRSARLDFETDTDDVFSGGPGAEQYRELDEDDGDLD